MKSASPRDNLRIIGLFLALGLVLTGQIIFTQGHKNKGLYFFVPGFVVAIVSARGKVPGRTEKEEDSSPIAEGTPGDQQTEEKSKGSVEKTILSPNPSFRIPVWVEVVLVVLIVAVGFGIRYYKITEIPPFLFDDESNTALDAIRVIDGHYRSPFVTGWYEVPTLYSYMNSISFRVFGINMLGARATGLAFATLTIAAMYFLCRYVFGVPLALMATTLFSTSRYHLTMSRWGATEIAPSFFMLMCFGLFLRGLQIKEGMTPKAVGPKPKTGFFRWPGWLFILSGFFLGICIYTYLASRLVALAVCLYMIYLLVLRFDLFKRHFWRMLLLGIVFLLVFSPLAKHYYEHPLTFSHRWHDIVIFKFCEQAGNMMPLWENLGRYMLMFNWQANQIGRHCLWENRF